MDWQWYWLGYDWLFVHGDGIDDDGDDDIDEIIKKGDFLKRIEPLRKKLFFKKSAIWKKLTVRNLTFFFQSTLNLKGKKYDHK